MPNNLQAMGVRHYNQSKSDLFKVTISKQEDWIASALNYWTNPLRQYDLCFTCGRYSERIDESRFASFCRNPSCRQKYNTGMGQHCQPDFIIAVDDYEGEKLVIKKSVIFVNGEDHDKKQSRKNLDKYQIIRLFEFGYKVFILKNKAIDNLYQMNLIALMKTFVEATKDDKLYRKMISKEKDCYLLPLLYGC